MFSKHTCCRTHTRTHTHTRWPTLKLTRKRNLLTVTFLTSWQKNLKHITLCTNRLPPPHPPTPPLHLAAPTDIPFFPPLWPAAAPAAAAAGWSWHTSGCRWPSARPAEPRLEPAPLGTTWGGGNRWGSERVRKMEQPIRCNKLLMMLQETHVNMTM